MNDEELDELILGRLRQRRAQATDTGDRTYSSADLAVFFNEPLVHIQDRLEALARENCVQESTAAPDRWMIVLAGDTPNS